MEIKVKEVSSEEQKSAQEVEAQLLKEHAEKEAASVDNDDGDEEGEEGILAAEDEANEKFLTLLKEKTGKTLEDIMNPGSKEQTDLDLPEEVKKYLDFNKETGRGLGDFVKANVDYDSLEGTAALKEYYRLTEKDLSSEDIEFLIEDEFGFDEELDDEKEVKGKQLKLKRKLAEAKEFLVKSKDKYKVPLESRAADLSEQDREAFNAYKKSIEEAEGSKESIEKKSKYFREKTKELFSNNFEGFDYDIGDKKIKFSPSAVDELMKSNSSINNFTSKHLDENGMIKDAADYHRSLSVALNPDKFAKHFYDQGVADQVAQAVKKSKNIDMDIRKNHGLDRNSGSGLKVKAVDDGSGSGLKIKV